MHAPGNGQGALCLRAQGCLLGQAVGDALGAIVEFSSGMDIRRRYPDGVRRMVASPVWGTLAGQITDDTELALSLAMGLAACGRGTYDPDLVVGAYGHWFQSDPFDVGNTIGQALAAAVAATGSSPAAAARAAANRDSQANGSLMRSSPLAVWGLRLSAGELDALARQDAALTHPHPVCRDAAAVFVVALRDVIAEGLTGAEAYARALRWQARHGETEAVATALAAAADAAPDYEVNIGHVVIALQNAFYQAIHAPSFAEGLVATVMGGGDTDANAAIAGALLGALNGPGAIPSQWLATVLTCRPEAGASTLAMRVRQARPAEYWPVAVIDAAMGLVPVAARDVRGVDAGAAHRSDAPAPETALVDRFRGALLGGAIGDALGRPMEGRGPSAFLSRPLAYRCSARGAKAPITDDTQLTICVAECLVARGHLDPRDLAQRFELWLPHAVGKGRATADAVERLLAGEPWYVAGTDSAGNGSAMRSAPIGLLRYRQAGLLRYESMLSSLPTHRHPMALAGAVAMAAATAWLVNLPADGWSVDGFVAIVRDAIHDIERGPEPERRDPSCRSTLEERIGILPELLTWKDPAEVFARLYNGAFVLESVPAALYCFLRSPRDLDELMVTAVNAGRDADTVAAMAGTLHGALCGAATLPPHLVDGVQQGDRLVQLADQLCEMTLSPTVE